MEEGENRVLVVGAGAVGQVYGLHLRRGGARVSFLVKPAHAAWCQQGFALHRLRSRRVTETDRLDDIEVLTDAGAAASLGWDQVWLTVASDALRGDWLGAFLGALGDATVVALQPDLDDRTLLLRYLPEAQLVQAEGGQGKCFLHRVSQFACQLQGTAVMLGRHRRVHQRAMQIAQPVIAVQLARAVVRLLMCA